MVYYGSLSKKVENWWNKISLTGCKSYNLNAPGTETPPSYPLSKKSILPFSAPLRLHHTRTPLAQFVFVSSQKKYIEHSYIVNK